MAAKLSYKPDNYYNRIRADKLKQEHKFKYEIGDLVSKYPGCVWEVIAIDWDLRNGARYHLMREVGDTRKRWKTAWVSESDVQPAFIV